MTSPSQVHPSEDLQGGEEVRLSSLEGEILQVNVQLTCK